MILQALSSSSSQQSTIKTMESFHWNARAQARNEHFMNTSIFLHFYRMDVDRFPSSKLIKIEHNGQSTDSDRPTFGFLNIYTMKRISPIARMWKWHEWLIDSASMWIISESQNMRDFFFQIVKIAECLIDIANPNETGDWFVHLLQHGRKTVSFSTFVFIDRNSISILFSSMSHLVLAVRSSIADYHFFLLRTDDREISNEK